MGGSLYLIRHGKTRLNSTGDSEQHKDRIRGWINVPLDAEGLREARQLAREAKKDGMHLDQLLCSDLGRTKQTAKILGDALGMKPKPARTWRPWGLGDFEGQPSDDAAKALRAYVLEKPDTPVPGGGESLNQFVGRVIPALRDLLTGPVADGQDIAIVTHYRVIKLVDAWLANHKLDNKILWKRFFMDHLKTGAVAEVQKITAGKSPGQWKFDVIGQEGHIDDPDAFAKGDPEGQVPPSAHYRKAKMSQRSCRTCSEYDSGVCEMFDARVQAGYVCDRWEPDTKDDDDGVDKGDASNGGGNAPPPTARPPAPPETGLASMTDMDSQYRVALSLKVTGAQQMPDSQYVYRVGTGDGRYVGTTQPTTVRAKKGDVVKVMADNLCRTPHGDFVWSSAQLRGRSAAPADGWKQLEAYAGDRIVAPRKDGGPAQSSATTPDSLSDQGTAGALASGPTSRSVHVNRPLRRLSILYKGEPVDWELHKTDGWKRIAYGVVLEPFVEDSQGDVMEPAEIELAAHRYLAKAIRGQATVHKLQHRATGFFRGTQSTRKAPPGQISLGGKGLVPVESFIAPCDFTYTGGDTIRKGSWVLAAYFEDTKLWQQVLDGTFTGWSVGGTGKRTPMGAPVITSPMR